MNKSLLLFIFLSLVLGCGESSNSDNRSSIPLESGFNPKCSTYSATITIYPSPYQGTLRRCIASDRQFYIYLPENYSEVGTPYPAMFSLHMLLLLHLKDARVAEMGALGPGRYL